MAMATRQRQQGSREGKAAVTARQRRQQRRRGSGVATARRQRRGGDEVTAKWQQHSKSDGNKSAAMGRQWQWQGSGNSDGNKAAAQRG
jgi:hypothetical protein